MPSRAADLSQEGQEQPWGRVTLVSPLCPEDLSQEGQEQPWGRVTLASPDRSLELAARGKARGLSVQHLSLVQH
ncbi:hypothetical protein H8959_006945 [Pygathrix nigripes]